MSGGAFPWSNFWHNNERYINYTSAMLKPMKNTRTIDNNQGIHLTKDSHLHDTPDKYPGSYNYVIVQGESVKPLYHLRPNTL